MTQGNYGAADCLAQAKRCEEEAERATSDAQRIELLWLARQWRMMARLAQQLASKGQTPH